LQARHQYGYHDIVVGVFSFRLSFYSVFPVYSLLCPAKKQRRRFAEIVSHSFEMFFQSGGIFSAGHKIHDPGGRAPASLLHHRLQSYFVSGPHPAGLPFSAADNHC
jgi:hypothetical protein